MNKTLKIATRKSPLALWQANFVKSELQKLHPDLQISLVKMTTKGDKILNSPLSEVGGKGLFVKELEYGLLAGEADLAVHSVKDIPYKIPAKLSITTILKRENPFDALVSNDFDSIENLPQNAKIGTCSKRRIVQLKAIRPDVQILDLRGNVNTRLEKLDAGEFDAIILACAGLLRLGFGGRISQQIPASHSLPAVGQGSLGVELRKNDEATFELIKPLIDEATSQQIAAERAMNAKLEGGCSSPIAGFATIKNAKITLTGLVGNVETSEILLEQMTSDTTDAKALGINLADKLLSLGARKILGETL